MLGTMRDATQPLALRLDMAKAAAPYVHSRLASVEQTGQVTAPEPVSITVEFEQPDGSLAPSLPL
jgi:hypothetical protein